MDLKETFYADYTTGTRWDNSDGNLQITWSARADLIFDEKTLRDFNESELQSIREAIASFDLALDTVSFLEVAEKDSPQLVLGLVAMESSPKQNGAVGYWNTWSKNGVRTRGAIKLKGGEINWFKSRNHFIHTVQHELGNTLGLGDIRPTPNLVSVLEDPWQPPYGKSQLSKFDRKLVRQLYGESTCDKNRQRLPPPKSGRGSQGRSIT